MAKVNSTPHNQQEMWGLETLLPYKSGKYEAAYAWDQEQGLHVKEINEPSWGYRVAITTRKNKIDKPGVGKITSVS